MPYMNKVFLMGHVGNVDIRYTSLGTEIVAFSLAVKSRDRTDWFNIAAFNKPWLKDLEKGELVLVEGEIHITKGSTRTFVDVIARRVVRLKKRKEKLYIEEDLSDDDVIELI